MDGGPGIERTWERVAVPRAVAAAPRVLLFGGSFDPVHRGHTELALAAARRWGGPGCWAVFVPAARSPHKQHEPIPDRHRVEMLRLSLRNAERWWIWEQELSDAELNPGAPSYWADTWMISRRVFGGERAFLIGTDQALSMYRWHRYETFWHEALVMRRGDGSDVGFLESMHATGAWSDADLAHWQSRLVDVPTVDVSSSSIRETLGAQENARREFPDGLDPGVFRYIEQRGLYRG